jgi:hypothetical protein
VIENYLPVLNVSDVNANRHRECHAIPEPLRALRPLIKIHIEVNSFQVKLYEGKDFDFIATKPVAGHGS